MRDSTEVCHIKVQKWCITQSLLSLRSPWFLYVLCVCLLVCSVSSIFSRNTFSLVLSYYCWSHPFRFIGKSIREQCSKEWKNRKYSSIIITFPAFLFAKIIRIKLYFCNIYNTIVKDWSKRGSVFSGSSTHKNANKKIDNFQGFFFYLAANKKCKKSCQRQHPWCNHQWLVVISNPYSCKILEFTANQVSRRIMKTCMMWFWKRAALILEDLWKTFTTGKDL